MQSDVSIEISAKFIYCTRSIEGQGRYVLFVWSAIAPYSERLTAGCNQGFPYPPDFRYPTTKVVCSYYVSCRLMLY